MVTENYEAWGNKRKVIDMIKNFVKYPTDMPKVRFDYINSFMEKLKKNREISTPHYNFLKRVLGVEYEVILYSKAKESERNNN